MPREVARQQANLRRQGIDQQTQLWSLMVLKTNPSIEANGMNMYENLCNYIYLFIYSIYSLHFIAAYA